MAANAHISITPEVEVVLRHSTVRDNVLFLPPEQLDRKLYEAVNKVLELLGGKWKSGKVKGHVFLSDPGLALEEALDSGEVLDAKRHFQFYPTPQPIAEVVVNLANVGIGHRVLEPSAGDGGLLAKFPVGVKADACEVQDHLRDHLFAKGAANVVAADFLSYSPGPVYDRIVANPPFTKGQAVKHADHMLDCMAPGGRLVCVLPSGVQQNSDRATVAFRQRLQDQCSRIQWMPLPEDAFRESGTLVRTVLLVAECA